MPKTEKPAGGIGNEIRNSSKRRRNGTFTGIREVMRKGVVKMKSEHSKMEYVRLTMEEYQTLIEAEPVKHGKWLISSDSYYPYCSECGKEPKSREMTKYCAECGAKMDKE